MKRKSARMNDDEDEEVEEDVVRISKIVYVDEAQCECRSRTKVTVNLPMHSVV